MSTNYRKPFNQALFDKHDSPARKAAKKAFKKVESMQGKYLVENFYNEFNTDMLILEDVLDGKIEVSGSIEVEVKTAFKGTTYTYNDIRIPERKLKFRGSHWFMFNSDCTACFFIPAEVVDKAPMVYVANKYSGGEKEGFLSIDPAKCQLIILCESKPTKPSTDADDLYK